MKFLIGTQNSEKVSTAQKVIAELLGGAHFTVKGVDVASGFGETPTEEQTKIGAQNRAKALLQTGSCDYAIGLESGLVERYQDTYEEAWCCVKSSDGTATYGYSSGLKVPDILTKKMAAEDLEHFEALRSDEIKALLVVQGRKDTWANYSAHMLVRRISFEEALRNALVQIFAPKESLYHQ
jgi:non-canonical (house-cleaning) NTP pyrophosphatase